MTNRINAVIVALFAAMCGIAILSYSHQLTDPYILPKWCFTIGAGCLWLTVWTIAKLCTNRSCFNRTWAGCIIALLCVLEAVYGITKWEGWSSTGIKGSFDNPAGFAVCLCIGIPFSLYFNKIVKGKQGKIITLLSVLLMTIGVILSESRSGIISFFVMAIITGYKKLTCPPMIKRSIVSLSLIIILVGGYWVKKDSADGRLLIWNCAWEMIKDAPLTGHGSGSFRAHYMDYQAAYIEAHPDSHYVTLADNVLSPFNEYIHFTLNFGLIGLFLIFIGTGYLWWKNRNRKDIDGKVAAFCLYGIGIFSLFSYPFTYPFTWIAVLFCIATWIKPLCKFSFPNSYKRLLYCCFVIACGIIAHKLYERLAAEYRWSGIAYTSNNENLEVYEQLIPILGKGPYFLYNYAVALRDNKNINKAFEVATTCRKYWADYDLELLLGDILKTQEQWEQSEIHFKKASNMCPSRFVPLYYLMEIYRESGDKKQARNIAHLIVQKPVKIQSSKIRLIKAKAKETLKQYHTNDNLP